MTPFVDMKILDFFYDKLSGLQKKKSRNVALVLGGGGARGYAHIGAIEALQEHGYNITSVAGTSMGALVGGLFAAGKLQEMKDTIFGLKRKQILSLMDISFGLDHIASGEKLQKFLEQMTGNIRIEDLPINFCCVASDVASGKEFVFREGSLGEAIRASISIPCVFSPVRITDHIFVDGSVHNTLPLNRVARNKGDILVAVNASAPNEKPLEPFTAKGTPRKKLVWSMALRVAQLSIQNNTQMAEQLTPPGICVNVPMDKYGLFDFDKGPEIIEYGRRAMEQQL